MCTNQNKPNIITSMTYIISKESRVILKEYSILVIVNKVDIINSTLNLDTYNYASVYIYEHWMTIINTNPLPCIAIYDEISKEIQTRMLCRNFTFIRTK